MSNSLFSKIFGHRKTKSPSRIPVRRPSGLSSPFPFPKPKAITKARARVGPKSMQRSPARRGVQTNTIGKPKKVATFSKLMKRKTGSAFARRSDR